MYDYYLLTEGGDEYSFRRFKCVLFFFFIFLCFYGFSNLRGMVLLPSPVYLSGEHLGEILIEKKRERRGEARQRKAPTVAFQRDLGETERGRGHVHRLQSWRIIMPVLISRQLFSHITRGLVLLHSSRLSFTQGFNFPSSSTTTREGGVWRQQEQGPLPLCRLEKRSDITRKAAVMGGSEDQR